MTRREFIANASIAAVGKLMSTPVRSLIGGRIVGETSSEPPAVSPYVQDGLIAMWDGIDNRLNTFNLRITPPSVSIEYDEFFGLINCGTGMAYLESRDIEAIQDAYRNGEISMESVLSWNCSNNNTNFVRMENSPYALWIHSHHYGTYVRDGVLQKYSEYPMEINTAKFYAGVSISLSKRIMTTWYNSEFRQLELPSDSDLSQKIMTKLNCGLDPNNGIGAIRFYDRQLTMEEISYNHEIDRERFNLR